MQKITTFLWFENNAEEAALFYTSVFADSEILDVTRLPDGKTSTVTYRLFDQQYIALNGGPHFTFTEAISLYVDCADQAEVDTLWTALLADGGMESQCGWLKDKFGLSWQIIPRDLPRLLADPDADKANRVLQAMLKMVKIDVQALHDAANG
ncbi:VOC family protein [Stackebrandtia soli]|uniref:VOC family protein n=1 Tax=Stackebrandtia soli TaxID=1892856 RepID=UPI0039EAA1A4